MQLERSTSFHWSPQGSQQTDRPVLTRRKNLAIEISKVQKSWSQIKRLAQDRD